MRQKKEEYKLSGATRKILLQEPLQGMKGEQVTVARVTVPAGWVGGEHYHTGPVYLYVLGGTFAVDEKGKDRQTLSAGTLYREPVGKPMQGRNPSASQAAEVLVVQIAPPGEQLMIKTDEPLHASVK